MALPDKFWAKVERGEGCWVWVGAIQSKGYGSFWSNGRSTLAHRVSYRDLVGEIPDGETLDHLCRNLRCVNPDHLEPVTREENLRRKALAITHCRRGHSLPPQATR